MNQCREINVLAFKQEQYLGLCAKEHGKHMLYVTSSDFFKKGNK